MDLRLYMVLIFKERNDTSRLDKILTHQSLSLWRFCSLPRRIQSCGSREPGLESQLGLQTVRYRISESLLSLTHFLYRTSTIIPISRNAFVRV